MLLSVAGQSNADGRGDIQNVPNYLSLGLNLPFPAVGFLEKRLNEAADPLIWTLERGPVPLNCRVGGNAGVFGPEVPLGRYLFNTGVPLNIVKMAIGSTSLNNHWNPNGTYPSNGQGENLARQWMNFCLLAQRTWGEPLKWIVWVQGETDGGNSLTAGLYETNLRNIINFSRGYFPGVKWILNRLHIQADANYDTVRAAQNKIAATVPGVMIIDCDDLALNGLHFMGAELWTLGERFGAAIRPVYFNDLANDRATKYGKVFKSAF